MNILRFKALFSRKAKQALYDEALEKELQRTESTSSYMQNRRKIYVNMPLPSSELDDQGQPIVHQAYVPNRIRTAKYTPLSFIPKNLFEQFRNVANLYFLFLVVLQAIPLFGTAEPVVAALPLICILAITGIKDGIEDLKRNQSDQRVNSSTTLTLSHWRNVNTPEETKSSIYLLEVFLGFFCMLAGVENRFTHAYRMSLDKDIPIQQLDRDFFEHDTSPLNQVEEEEEEEEEKEQSPPPATDAAAAEVPDFKVPASAKNTKSPLKNVKFLDQVRQRSDTFRSEFSNILQGRKKIYRPGTIPHSVLHRAPSRRRSSSIHPGALKCSELPPGDPPTECCKVWWHQVQWQDVQVGDYVMIRNDEDVPADIIILSTSEKDNLCYVETQNLDGETNLKVRQGLKATEELRSVHDCERAHFYFESEPPHANLYQYNGVMRWDIENMDEEDDAASVSHQKTEAVTYNNLLLRGCVLRNTRWAIGIIVYTGDETKIMLNSGKTPSKRSKIAKQTNPFVTYNVNKEYANSITHYYYIGHCKLWCLGCTLYC
jgi:phospholipid-translocating ATPase